jgi:hypothetical protein
VGRRAFAGAGVETPANTHTTNAHLPPILQVLEHWLGFGKGVSKDLSDRRTDLTWNVVMREQAEQERKMMLPADGQHHEDKTEGPMIKFRKNQPLTNVAIPKFLIDKYPVEWGAFKEKRLEAFGHGGAWTTTDGYTVFTVTGAACAVPAHAAKIGAYLGVQPNRPAPALYKTCARPPDEWFQYQQRTGGWSEAGPLLTNGTLKKYLWDHGQGISGTKAVLVRRIGKHLVNTYGEPLEAAAADALTTPAQWGGGAMDTGNDDGVDDSAGHQDEAASEEVPAGDLTTQGEIILTLRLGPPATAPAASTPTAPAAFHTLGRLREETEAHKYLPPDVAWPNAASSRRETRFAYRVIDLSRDAPVGEMNPIEENLLSEYHLNECVVEHVKGHKPSPWISLTLDLTWALFFATKSILLQANTRAVIVEIDLEKISTIVNLSLPSRATAMRLPAYWGVCAWSASEVLVPRVPADALTGSAWQLDDHSRVGGTILSIRGNDHEKKGVVIKKFGRYELWKEYFDGKYPNETRLANALKALELKTT